MKKLLSALAFSALIFAPAARAGQFVIVNPQEPMVVVPGLERLGPSRISTVQHCASLSNVEDYNEMITDSQFEAMEACLIEHT